MNMEYFTYPSGFTMTGRALERLIGGPARQPESKLTQREMDLARSIQDITEEVMLKMTAHAHKVTGMRDLCLAGGVALNCVGNGRVLREGPFDQIWIQPAAGDAGGALGVALALAHRYKQVPRASAEALGTWERPSSVKASKRLPRYADGMQGSFLGPKFENEQVAQFVDSNGYKARRYDQSEIADRIAMLMSQEKGIGLFQGRMEVCPRALVGR